MSQQILLSIFDRIFYPHQDERHNQITTAHFCEAVRRDLEQLLNTRSADVAAALPNARKSVLNYGIDHLSPRHLAISHGQQLLVQQLTTAITRFEPRLRNVSVVLINSRASQRLRFRIEANLLMNSQSQRVCFDSMLQIATSTLSIVRTAP